MRTLAIFLTLAVITATAFAYTSYMMFIVSEVNRAVQPYSEQVEKRPNGTIYNPVTQKEYGVLKASAEASQSIGEQVMEVGK